MDPLSIATVGAIESDINNKLTILFRKLIETSRKLLFIFESIRIYHRPMKQFLVSKDYPFVEVSPLLAAKHRYNSAARSAKTDALDAFDGLL